MWYKWDQMIRCLLAIHFSREGRAWEIRGERAGTGDSDDRSKGMESKHTDKTTNKHKFYDWGIKWNGAPVALMWSPPGPRCLLPATDVTAVGELHCSLLGSPRASLAPFFPLRAQAGSCWDWCSASELKIPPRRSAGFSHTWQAMTAAQSNVKYSAISAIPVVLLRLNVFTKCWIALKRHGSRNCDPGDGNPNPAVPRHRDEG